jgi:hypothetical protein
MYRTHILALTVTLAACGTATEAPHEKVEQTVSGLRPDGVTSTPGVPGGPDDREREITELDPGTYTAVIVGVRHADQDRTDLYEGAEFTYELSLPPVGSVGHYQLDGFLAMYGWNGGLRGRGSDKTEDPKFYCSMVTKFAVEGRAPDTDRFQLMVRERVIVEGDECELSDLGPARAEVNLYRLEFNADF